MSQKVNILGTEYHIEYKNIADDPYLEKCDGYVDRTTKKSLSETKSVIAKLVTLMPTKEK